MRVHGLVRIGNVRNGSGVIEPAGLITSHPGGGAVYATARPVRRHDDEEDPRYTLVRRGHRRAHSSTYQPYDVGEVAPIRPVRVPPWQEKEIVPGLRICVQQGRRWTAEKLDSGQVLLTPVRGPSSEVGAGALMRDTDGHTREISDPIPQPGGSRW